jgi:hypothetical protein
MPPNDDAALFAVDKDGIHALRLTVGSEDGLVLQGSFNMIENLRHCVTLQKQKTPSLHQKSPALHHPAHNHSPRHCWRRCPRPLRHCRPSCCRRCRPHPWREGCAQMVRRLRQRLPRGTCGGTRPATLACRLRCGSASRCPDLSLQIGARVGRGARGAVRRRLVHFAKRTARPGSDRRRAGGRAQAPGRVWDGETKVGVC